MHVPCQATPRYSDRWGGAGEWGAAGEGPAKGSEEIGLEASAGMSLAARADVEALKGGDAGTEGCGDVVAEGGVGGQGASGVGERIDEGLGRRSVIDRRRGPAGHGDAHGAQRDSRDVGQPVQGRASRVQEGRD